MSGGLDLSSDSVYLLVKSSSMDSILTATVFFYQLVIVGVSSRQTLGRSWFSINDRRKASGSSPGRVTKMETVLLLILEHSA